MRRRARLAFGVGIVAGVSLAVPTGASAVEIGSSNLGAVHEGTQQCSNASQPCIGAQDTIVDDPYTNVVPDGHRVITGFRFQSDTQVSLVVLRQTGPSSFTRKTATGYKPGNGLNTVASHDAHLLVEPGDFIGVRLPAGGRIAALNGDCVSDPITCAWELPDAPSPNTILSEDPAELLLDATVERDDDCDGLGDDSEDPELGTCTNPPPPVTEPDPLAPLRAGKRPKAKILGRRYRASTKGVVKLKLQNPHGFDIKGRLTFKRKRRGMGAKTFRMGQNRSGYVKVKLRRSARRLLARKRRLKVTVYAKVRGPIGKAGTTKKTITVLAPKRSRRRQGATGPGSGGGGGLPPFLPPCGILSPWWAPYSCWV